MIGHTDAFIYPSRAVAMVEHIERATRLIADQDYREAVRICRRALLAHPESIKLRLLLGRGLLAMGRFDEVRTEMLAVLRSSPQEVRAYRFLGEAYLYDGRPDRAIDAFHKALEIDPSDEEVQRLLDDAAFEEPTATAEQIVPGAAEITRESLLPAFGEDDEHTEPTQRALPKAVFRERKQVSTGTRSYSMPPGSLPPPGRLPTGIAGSSDDVAIAEAPVRAHSARVQSAVRSRTSVPPPPPPEALSHRPSKPLSKGPSTVPPPPMRKMDPGPEKPLFQKTLLGSASPSNEPEPARKAKISLGGFDTEPGDTKDTWNTADALLSGELDAMEKSLLDRPDTSDFDDLPTEVQHPPTAMRANPISERPAPLSRTGRPAPRPVSSEPTVAEDFDDHDVFEDDETKDRDPLWKSPAQDAVPPPSEPPPVDQRKRVRRASGRSSTKRWILGGIALVLLFGLGFGLTAWWRLSSREDEMREAVTAVTRHGGAANYERALGLARRQDERLLAARLMAARAFEYGGAKAADVRQALTGLDETKPNYALALGYLALLEGQPKEALRLLDGFAIDAEAQHISSLAQLEVGDWDEARKNARSAAQLIPGAARFEAQRVMTEAVTGVGGTPPSASSDHLALQVASLIHRYMTGKGVAIERAQQLLSQELTVADQAWLRWLLLRAAIDSEQVHPARKMADALTSDSAMQALRHAPSPLRLLIATAMLDMNEPEKAAKLFASLGDEVRARPEALAPQVHMLLLKELVDDARALLRRAPNKTPSVELLQARVELADGKHEAAIKALEGAMQDPRTRKEAMTLAAESYRALGKWKDAIRMIEPVWKVRKSHVETTQKFIESLLAAGEPERALKVIDGFEQAGGDPSVTAVSRVRINLDSGNLEAAKEAAEKLNVSTPEAIAAKAQVLRRTGKLDEASELLSKGLEGAPRHEGMLQEMVLVSLRRYAFTQARKSSERLDPSKPRSKTLAAFVAITNAGGADALENVENLENVNDADMHVYRAYGLYHAEKDADARRAFEYVLKLRPGHPEALAGEALLALRVGALSRADASADAALKAAGEVGKKFEARAIAVQAKLHYERGGFQKAEELVARALRLNADCALAHLVAASLDEERGRNATPDFKKATESDFVMPEALARYALSSKKPLCDMAKRYLAAAPNGYDAPDMRRISSRCK